MPGADTMKLPVRGATVAALREHARISTPELARRMKAAGDEREETAVEAFLRRLDQREIAKIRPEWAAALAEGLGVEPEHLTEEVVWAWGLLSLAPDGSRSPLLGFYELGGVLVGFSEPGDAARWRDVLALRRYQGAASIEVVPVTRSLLRERGMSELGSLREAFEDSADEDVVLIDPSEDRLQALMVCEEILLGTRDPEQIGDGVLALAARVNLHRLWGRLYGQLDVARRRPDPDRADMLARELRNLRRTLRALETELGDDLEQYLGREP